MLKIVNLSSGYGVLRVVNRLSLHVRKGEIVALVGVNGSGKTTLLNTIAGLIRPMEGRILLGDKDLASLPAEKIAAKGLTLVPEGRGLFPGMTVHDNLCMGGYAKNLKGNTLSTRLKSMCDLFPALKDRMNEYAGNLSGGQQQMLALARALVGQPDVLLLDEPSTGLAPILVSEVFHCIQGLKQTGMAIILAEQNVQKALNVADRAYVMQTGKVVLEDRADRLRESDQVRRAYLGME